MTAASVASALPMKTVARPSSRSQTTTDRMTASPMGYNGERKDTVTGLYHLGSGYRSYSPSLMRFHSADSMSPFGRGGINKYAYCLGDPINKHDPSGHFAIMSLLVGAIIGAVVGAGISAIAEGVRAAAAGDSFDGKQVAIGAMLGFISGGFGAAGAGLKTATQVGLAIADTVTSGAVDFGINIALGANPKDAGINAGVGASIGLAAFGAGVGVRNLFGSSIRAATPRNYEPGIRKIGRMFQLHQKNPSIPSKNLILSAHGAVSPLGRFKVTSRLNYYVPHGRALLDPGLDDVAKGLYRPTESIAIGASSKRYFLANYASDDSFALDTAKRFGVDVLTVTPSRLTTNKRMLRALTKEGLNYDEIEMIHCRSFTPWSKESEAVFR
ncbi:RHS repeat-associated core domain-containing protein [Vibrio coralliilyticus]|nr:RHS repeat-associated core domain-containing protein [Vibrio coralliilyticus]NRF12890.1 RHS repeat-associated core domain-containing protein [Vibrio coralliilyticus]